MGCTCNEVKVGGSLTGAYNIADDCPEHGVDTEYFRNYCEQANARLRELYARRDEARKEWREGTGS